MTLTITVAYVSFFVGENELKVSGVLATIFTALMVSRICKPLLCDKAASAFHLDTCSARLLCCQDGLQAIWHTLEFFGNTILFVLCGVFAYTACKKVEWADFAWLGLLYILGNLARGLMIAMLAPLVNLVGGSDVTFLGKADC